MKQNETKLQDITARQGVYKSHIIRRINGYYKDFGQQQRVRLADNKTIDELLAMADILSNEFAARHLQAQLNREFEAANHLAQMAAAGMPQAGEIRVDADGQAWIWAGLQGWLWQNNRHVPAPPAPLQVPPMPPLLNNNHMINNHMIQDIMPDLIPIPGAGAAAPVAPPPPALAGFVADRQNVHLSDTVRYVMKIFGILSSITIPTGQNTVSDIIRDCGLSGRAIITLTVFYYEPTPIYEIDKAYPKALDAIWAFIQTHPEKAELISRVRDELTDNIGMCAQGNLTRLCNILSGYVDGAAPPRPRHEILQEKIAAIAADDEDDKVARAEKVLTELEVPLTAWADWLSAL
jgi:hypothetical protein